MRIARLIPAICICLLLACPTWAQTKSADELRELQVEADDLAAAGKHKEALPLYEKVLGQNPDNQGALYNAALSYFMTGDYPNARKAWEKLEQLAPDDWIVKAKLIQTYQAENNMSARDRERAALLEMRKKARNLELNKTETFCREQSTINGKRVMVLEHFEMKGDRAVRYAFVVLNGEGKEDYHLSLGSYDLTNAIWAEKNKARSKAGIRLYHLDGYYSWGHATYGFFEGEPSYDDIRKSVVGILGEKLKPVSTTTFPGKQK